MIPRARILLLYIICILLTAAALASRGASAPDERTHEQWVAESFKEMQSVKVGMMRSDLETVFETEGGLSGSLHRSYTYKHCRYFKVDVVFSGASPVPGGNESENDKIISISTPYIAWPRGD
jgi:hypothetical protein